MKEKRQDRIETSTCLLCGGEPETNIILSTSGTVEAFDLCFACRDYSISDIIEELSFQVKDRGKDK